MSFILDALRKSENERQRGAVPGIADVPAVVSRTRIPKWVLGVISGLSLCLVAVGWAWLRGITPARVEIAPTAADERVTIAPPEAPRQVRNLAREARQAASNPPPPREPTTPTRDGGTAAQTEPTATAPAVAPATMAELTASGTALPELNLELHVFSAMPAERFVFINSAKYQEGDVLREGPRVLGITEEGVILSYRDRPFLLPTD